MKILYIDPDTNIENKATRAGWIRGDENHVDVASGVDVPFSDYDLVIVFLGDRGSEFDMRPALANKDIAHTRENLGTSFLFAGIDDRDMLFAQTHRAASCKLFEFSEPESRDAILAKATGASIHRG